MFKLFQLNVDFSFVNLFIDETELYINLGDHFFHWIKKKIS